MIKQEDIDDLAKVMPLTDVAHLISTAGKDYLAKDIFLKARRLRPTNNIVLSVWAVARVFHGVMDSD